MMKKSFSLAIPSQEILSEMIIEKGLLHESHWIDLLRRISNRFVIITDHHVRDLMGHSLKSQLEKEKCEVYLFSVPPGEKSKTRQWKETLEDQMVDAGLGRDTVVIALGGGVITDLAGFVAATYCRGVPLISIPTTLIGQVDASIGGKVGVNVPGGKNLIGTFYHPHLILIDPEILSTLPPQEILNGMAEVIKYALIAAKDLFRKLQKHTPWEELIEESCFIKKEIVEKDPQEKGLRRILNFGHTVGHAIETCTDYQIPHGEAVALGMLAEAHMSCKLGYLEEEELLSIDTLLKGYGFSLQLPSTIDEKTLIQAMRLDKKALSSEPRFVLLQEIGETLPFDEQYCCSVDPRIVQEALRWL